MLRIGDFARLGQITIKALHHYDELGLLKPARVDEVTGYRLYTIAQLQHLNRILALKELGFSLDEIAAMTTRDLTLQQLRQMLQQKRDALQIRIRDEQERLERVEARLKIIAQENRMSHYDVVLKKVEPQLVASVREVIHNSQVIGTTFNRIFDEVCAHVVQHDGKIIGPGFDLWHDPDFTTPLECRQNMSVEAAVPIAEPLPESERVKIYEMPGAEQMACVFHKGSFELFPHAYGAVLQWIEANGYRIVGPSREVYLQYERGGNENELLTEIQFPVAKA